jgi:hypothetical protein
MNNVQTLRFALIALSMTGCFFTEPPIVLTEQQAFDSIQERMKSLEWPLVQAFPVPDHGDQVTATPAHAALRAVLDVPPTDQVAGFVAARCAEIAAATDASAAAEPTAKLLAYVDPAGTPIGTDLADETRLAFGRMQLFSIYWIVDIVRWLEDPVTGPDADIYIGFKHYHSTKGKLVALGQSWVESPPQTEVELRAPANVALARELTKDAIGVLLDFKAAYATSETDAFAFAGKWLAVDFKRYINIYDNGLPRFSWLADLNDITLDQKDHIWSQWDVNDNPVADVANEMAALTEDLRAVQGSWRTQLTGKFNPATPSEAAAAICAAQVDTAAAVLAVSTDRQKTKSNLVNRLYSKLMATMRFGQAANDVSMRGTGAAPSTP